MRLGVAKPKPYTNSIQPKTRIHTPILKFHTCDLLFPFLLSSFLLSSSSYSFLFFSLLFVFALPFSKTKMRYLFWSYPFLFHFPRRKLHLSFLKATCLFHNFSSLFHSNIFLLLLFDPLTLLIFVNQFIIFLQ